MKRMMFGVVTGLALAACGGNDPSSDGSTANSSPPTEVDAQAPGTTDALDARANDPPASGDLAADDAPPAGDLGAEGSAVDACTLLTDEEVEAILGDSASAEPEVSPPFYGCRWSTGALSSVSVDVISWANPDIAQSSFDFYLGDVTPVDGIGDGALYNELVDLAFIIDSYEVTIDVTGEAPAARDHARELAPKVISRLP